MINKTFFSIISILFKLKKHDFSPCLVRDVIFFQYLLFDK